MVVVQGQRRRVSTTAAVNGKKSTQHVHIEGASESLDARPLKARVKSLRVFVSEAWGKACVGTDCINGASTVCVHHCVASNAIGTCTAAFVCVLLCMLGKDDWHACVAQQHTLHRANRPRAGALSLGHCVSTPSGVPVQGDA